MTVRVGLGQDSHAFERTPSGRALMLAGVRFDGHAALAGNSDADVVLHALCNAISGVTGVNVLGKATDDMCARGITDSREYVQLALSHLGPLALVHVSVSIECKTPKLAERIAVMRAAIGALVGLAPSSIGITATSGEGLTAFGRGEGIQAFCVVTAEGP
jgi:2-C-methyl-D-erythritol 2,4-cyclodiphosphate synthase